MSLKTKIIGAIVASALACPPAFAVEGSDGMHYTSASEGFYASIRAKYVSGANADDNGGFDRDNGTRLGLQGTGEMSHGLEGFYRYEAGIRTDNRSWDDEGDRDEDANSGIRTRLSYVGLRGGFGSVAFGTVWGDPYNWVGAVTDLPNVGGGNFVFGGFRKSRAIQYNTPDFNGLKVGADFVLDGGKDTAPVMPSATLTTMNAAMYEDMAAPDSELDEWALSAQYGFSGFTVAGTYINTPDQAYVANAGADNLPLEDGAAWAVSGTYSQDNWGVATWYGEDNNSDFTTGGVKNKENTSAFSVAGHVAVGKTKVVVMHETQESAKGNSIYDDSVSVFDIQYSLNSKSKVWVGYVAQNFDSNAAKDDYVNFGIRHDF